MSITIYPPNTIHLGGPFTEVNDIAASEAITPGMLIEPFNAAGVHRFRKSTLTGLASRHFARNHPMANKGVDDAYATGDLVEAGVASPGCTIWGLVASGQNIAWGQSLSDAGDGTFKASSGVTNARSLTTTGAVTANTRLRVEFV